MIAANFLTAKQETSSPAEAKRRRETRNLKHGTRNQKRGTRNQKRGTRNQKRGTRNPELYYFCT
jgi:hypothetical protein